MATIPAFPASGIAAYFCETQNPLDSVGRRLLMFRKLVKTHLFTPAITLKSY